MADKGDTAARIQGAIWGMFIGDALAMPVHWYYQRDALIRDYGRVTRYLAPKNPHPDSILWRSAYSPVNDRGDILHDQQQYWGQAGIHYHQFLRAGENTLNLQLANLLTDSLNANHGYDPDAYLDAYIHFMTTPGTHRDTYVEEYHRHFFTHYARGTAPNKCGTLEKHISGLIGMIPIAAYYASDPDQARQLAMAHLRLTHLGELMESAGNLLLDLLLPVFGGAPLADTILQKLKRQDNPLLGHPLVRWLDDPDEVVIGRRLSTACYVQDAVPAVVYLALKYVDDAAQGLVINTNLGGDNAGRGAVLGAVLGAANGFHTFPDEWVSGLLVSPSQLLNNI